MIARRLFIPLTLFLVIAFLIGPFLIIVAACVPIVRTLGAPFDRECAGYQCAFFATSSLLWCAGAPPVLAADAPAPRIEIPALAEIPFLSDPVLSPDGKRIVARVNSNGVEQIGIYTLADGGEARPKIVPTVPMMPGTS